MEGELVKKYGENQRDRIVRGLKQVADFWRSEDGDALAYEEFVGSNFSGDQSKLDVMFNRYQYLLEKLNGHMQEIGREFRTQVDLDFGPVENYDEIFAGYDVSAHTADDFFQNKLAFIVLLNFPLTTLEQRLAEGEKWTRRQWAEARLAQMFSKRIPAEVNLEVAKISSDADRYISDYNIWMHHLLDSKGERLFPPKLRLLSHWNLRDELKANYADEKNGLVKQKMIQQVMERIVTQTIPAVAVNNPNVDWNPFTNDVKLTGVKDFDQPVQSDLKISNSPEPDTRYATLLSTFKASQKIDVYSPTAPTLITRRFDENREIPELRVKAMFEQVLTSPLVEKVAKIIQKRLGRPLEPFDIWYNGFRQRSTYSEAQLDEIVSKKYPTPEAYKNDIPNMLLKLGFSQERAKYLADRIEVDPARGSGHAMGAGMKGEKAHLRTRVAAGGMNYKGFNIAVHEMGHNVEQIFSLDNIDNWCLQGVPNTAFTEAIAYTFQDNDLKLLDLAAPTSENVSFKVLNDFWQTYEIAGVSLVDMTVWHWMYDHPNSSPSELKEAVIKISKQIWNQYYAPVFKKKDVLLLGIYSHMIDSYMYLPDYTIGHLIAFQIEEQVKKVGNIGSEVERMALIGRIAPDLWMKKATGLFVGPESLIIATEKALKEIK
ncbi:MAG: hypothetical protein HZB59_01410 [Ignavibacteriales bacterium]|nr:hypothetical protein [Ignavibacteriales bacterium]